MSFLGNYADLTGHTIGNFSVYQLAGRDRNKTPIWGCRCEKCFRCQTFPHTKLVNAQSSGKPEQVLFCNNQACPRSRADGEQTRTLAELITEDQREQKRRDLDVQRQRELENQSAAKEAERQASLVTHRSRWNSYVVAQIRRGIEPKKIMPFDTWMQQSMDWQNDILDRLQKFAGQA